jgi:vancomycin resistance protein YoaR
MTSSPDPEIVSPDPEIVAAPSPTGRGRRLAMRFALSFLLGVAVVVGIGAGALYAWGRQYDGRILPGVHTGSIDLSGLTPDEARTAIAAAYAHLAAGSIVLGAPSGEVTIPEVAIGRGPDVGAILDAALAAGRQGAPLADLIDAPQAALRGVIVPEAVTYDRAKLAAAVDSLAATIDTPAVDATVTVATDGSFLPTAAKEGRLVDRAALLAALEPQLASLDAPDRITATVPVTTVAPVVTTDTANQAKAAADRIAVDLVFSIGSDRWTIAGSSVRSMIGFATAGGKITPTVNVPALDPLLKALTGQVNRKASNAAFRLSGNHVVVAAPSHEGRTMDVAATTAAVVGVLQARLLGTAEAPLAPVVAITRPVISSTLADGTVARMRAISTWKTWFPIGTHNFNGANIWVPAQLINGYVVAPGATFDFWKVVGTPTAAEGFGQGAAIINGHTSRTGAWAGGICSCSTTLFNAALRAGMKMGARANHFYYINRYPLGLDATVWMSGGVKQTMSWTNDTPYPVLIQGIKIRQGSVGWVKFVLWSVPNGRTIKIGVPTVKNYIRATSTTVRTNALRAGYSFQLEWPVDGEQVWRTVSVYQDGKLLRTNTYFSNYAVLNGILQIGTGGPGAPLPGPQ